MQNQQFYSLKSPSSDPTVADPEVDLFAGMKKKKKKVVQDLPVDDAAPSPAAAEPEAAPAAADVDAETSGSAAAPPADAAVEGDGAEMFADLKKKKKKKKEMPADIVSQQGEIGLDMGRTVFWTGMGSCKREGRRVRGLAHEIARGERRVKAWHMG